MALTRDRAWLAAVLVIAGAAAARPDVGFALSYLAGAAGLAALHERLRRAFDPLVALWTSVIVFAGTSVFWAMTLSTGPWEAVAFMTTAGLVLLEYRRPARLPVGLVWVALAVVPIAARLAVTVGETSGVSTRDVHAAWLAAWFSSSHGLVSLTPVVAVALIGTACSIRRAPGRVAATGAILVVWTAALTSLGPDGHGAPGALGWTGALPLLAPGLAVAIDTARRRPLLALAPVVIAAVTWNYWLMVQYTVGLLPKDAPVSFASLVRQQAEVHTRRPYVFPFALPASLWFAWREHLPAARYERLAHEPRRAALDLPMDRDVERFLLDGWDAAGSDGDRPLYWIRDRRATLAVPLELPPGRDAEVVITARARLEEPAVDALMGLEINGQEAGRFSVPAASPAEIRVVVPSAIGPAWRAGYNRLTLVSYGVRRVDPADSRPPGPLGRRSGDRAWPVAVYRVRIDPI